MAHYAFLDKDLIVTAVIVGKDEAEGDVDWEQHYGDFYGQICKRTSYNTRGGVHLKNGVPFRKNYAGIGYRYDNALDAFIPPKPYPSWLLDEKSCLWQPPVPMPEDKHPCKWDEDAQSWISI